MAAPGDRKKFVVSFDVGGVVSDGWLKMLAQWNLDAFRVPQPFEMAEQTEAQEVSERQPIEVRLDQAADFASFAIYCGTFEAEDPEARAGARRLAKRVCKWAEVAEVPRWERVLATRYLNDEYRLATASGEGEWCTVSMYRQNGYCIGGWLGPSEESLAAAGIRQAPPSNRERRAKPRGPGRVSWSMPDPSRAATMHRRRLSGNAKVLIVFAACMCGVALLVWSLMP